MSETRKEAKHRGGRIFQVAALGSGAWLPGRGANRMPLPCYLLLVRGLGLSPTASVHHWVRAVPRC